MTKNRITLIGLTIILISIFLLSFINKNPQLFNTRTTSNEDPINIQITNLNDSQFSISYITNGKNIGTIRLGTDPKNLDIVVLDDRDQLSQSINSYFVHQITPKDLNPNTTYYYSINSGNKTYLNNGVPFSITTGNKIPSDPPSQNPISGNVLIKNNQLPQEGIVYLTTEGSQKLSSLVINGRYTLPLNSLLTSNMQSYKVLSQDSTLNIQVISDGLSETESFSINEVYPIKDIVLNNPYKPDSNSISRGGVEINNTTDSATKNSVEQKINSSEIARNETEKDIENNDEKNNDSVIIFGLGAAIIVGLGITFFLIARKKNK